ncbi:hypothetical protein EDD25_1086 [Cryobacterium psychrophilum]|nr:hypothetical protein EDD25_1086 [Cryobacterium psychrophilum]
MRLFQGILLEDGETDSLQKRREVHAEPSAQTLLQTVPASDRVGSRTFPGLDRAAFGWFRLVRTAEVDRPPSPAPCRKNYP